MIIEHTDPEQDGTALVIEDGDKHSLISDGTTATLLPPWESTPPGTTTSIKLNGDGASAVGGFSGTVKLVETATDEWSLEVYDASVLVFEYEFSGPNQYLQSSGCNVPDACNGGCACSSCLICWCWCDIFGNPNCLCIIPSRPGSNRQHVSARHTMHCRLGCVLLALTTSFAAAPSADAEDPLASADAAQALIKRAAMTFAQYDSVSIRVACEWKTTALLGAREGSFDIRSHMSGSGPFRVVAIDGDDELAGVCFDGEYIVEWNAQEKRWTRYPARGRVSALRLTKRIAGQVPLAGAIIDYCDSWVGGDADFKGELLSNMNKADRIAVDTVTLDGQCRDTARLVDVREEGGIHAESEILLAFAPDTGLPVTECRTARLRKLILLGEETICFNYLSITPNVDLSAGAFRFDPPKDWLFVQPEATCGSHRLVGKNVRDWELQPLEGEADAIGTLCAEKPVLLVAFATWCAPCKLQLKELATWHASDKLADRFRVIALSTDQSIATARAFAERTRLPFKIVHDSRFLKRHSLSVVPTTLLIDNRGRIAHLWEGWGGDAHRRAFFAFLQGFVQDGQSLGYRGNP